MLQHITLILEPFQVRVKATDTALPPLSATATVTVSVHRNTYPPSFQQTQVTKYIPDPTISVGTGVLTLTASDRDTRVRKMTILCYVQW